VAQLKGVNVSKATKVVCRYSFEFKKRKYIGKNCKGEVATSTSDRLNLYIANDESEAFPPPREMVKIIHNHCGIKKGDHRDLANLALTEKNEEKVRKEFQKEGFYVAAEVQTSQYQLPALGG
jgi:hypothetical protein